MNKSKIDKPELASLLAPVCVLFLVAGCGGGMPVADAKQVSAQAPVTANAQYYAGTASPPAASGTSLPARADTSSFTLNSTAEFKGFNPRIWNDPQAWYECDCARNSRAQPRTMPWNPA